MTKKIYFTQAEAMEFAMWLGINFTWVNQWTWKDKVRGTDHGINYIIKTYVRDKKLQESSKAGTVLL